MAVKLSTLPTELVQIVAKELEDADLWALYSVCRGLKEKTIKCVGDRFFMRIRTDLSYGSLQHLKGVSEHQQIRNHVRHLNIFEGPNGMGRGFWPRRPSSHPEASKPLMKILCTILDGFVNCRSFSFYFAHNIKYDEGWTLTSSDAVALIIAIIADTSLPIKGFQIPSFSHKHDVNGSLVLSQSHIENISKPRFGAGWVHLQELKLEHIITSRNLDWTVGLVLGASNLQKLHLNPSSYLQKYTLDATPKSDAFSIFSSFLEVLSSTNKLPRLREFHLSTVSITEEQLCRVMLCFSDSLRAFSLHCVRITGGGTWASAFKRFGGELSSLQKFHIKVLSEKGTGDELGKLLTFHILRKDPTLRNIWGQAWDFGYHDWSMSYQGSRVSKAFEFIAASISYEPYEYTFANVVSGPASQRA